MVLHARHSLFLQAMASLHSGGESRVKRYFECELKMLRLPSLLIIVTVYG